MNKKVIDIFSLFLVILFFVITIWALTGCQKKQTIIEYKVAMIEKPNTFACKYTLTAKDREPITMFDICGKFKSGDVVLRVIE
jgi:uncharacterized lipoprotein YajG